MDNQDVVFFFSLEQFKEHLYLNKRWLQQHYLSCNGELKKLHGDSSLSEFD